MFLAHAGHGHGVVEESSLLGTVGVIFALIAVTVVMWIVYDLAKGHSSKKK